MLFSIVADLRIITNEETTTLTPEILCLEIFDKVRYF